MEEDDEEGDWIILVFFFFLGEKFLVWVCAHVHYFTLVLDCAALVI